MLLLTLVSQALRVVELSASLIYLNGLIEILMGLVKVLGVQVYITSIEKVFGILTSDSLDSEVVVN